jgi:hypothetical protein
VSLLETDPRSAGRRAAALLRSMLTPLQQRELRRFKGFRVVQEPETYWVPMSGRPIRSLNADTLLLREFCVAPLGDGWMPGADVAITMLLWLSTEPETVEDRKVTVWSRHVEQVRTIEDVYRYVVPPIRRARRSGNRAAVRSRRTPPSLPTVAEVMASMAFSSEDERRVVRERVHALRLEFATQRLRDVLKTNGVDATDEAIVAVAERRCKVLDRRCP